ncbi:SRPBCC family protein [Streptomyces sp. NPDC001941]|uniref:SRPBCC family protein n=1 Tax=Streptomyces sp. NPDC001941 TaxID=3154659 RepID=UPI003325084D
MQTQRLEAERVVDAPAAQVFAVLCDPHGHVDIDSSGMLQAAWGGPVRRVGDGFTVRMDRSALNDEMPRWYDVEVTITAFAPARHIEWTVGMAGGEQVQHRYGYHLTPQQPRGTHVVSYYDWSGALPRYQERGIFPMVPESALRATLGILARVVAPGRPPRRDLPAQWSYTGGEANAGLMTAP